MNRPLGSLRIDEERLRAHFEGLAAIGATPDGGVDRPAFSAAHLEARRCFLEQARPAGLEARTDGAGNHSAFLACGRPGPPCCWAPTSIRCPAAGVSTAPWGWSPQREDTAQTRLANVLERIEQQEFPPESAYCPSCEEFRAICPYAPTDEGGCDESL